MGEKKAQAEKERREYILQEASVRAAFHRELRRWIELVNPSAVDVAELERLGALRDSRSPQPEIIEKSGRNLKARSCDESLVCLNHLSARVDRYVHAAKRRSTP